MATASSPRTGPVGIAFIGAGVISKEYLENLTRFPDVKVHIVADLFETPPPRRPPSSASPSPAASRRPTIPTSKSSST